MFCPKCGSTIPDDALFCGECGQQAAIRPETDSKENTENTKQPLKEKSKLSKKSKMLIWISCGAALLLAIAAVLVFVVFTDGEVKPVSDSTEKETPVAKEAEEIPAEVLEFIFHPLNNCW